MDHCRLLLLHHIGATLVARDSLVGDGYSLLLRCGSGPDYNSAAKLHACDAHIDNILNVYFTHNFKITILN